MVNLRVKFNGKSVLPPLNKVFERLLSNQIKEYFLSSSILCAEQHGFRPSHSCESALHEIVSHCLSNLDSKLITALIFVDFKKAFDMIDPVLLIYKLLNYGFDNKAIKLITNYFKCRNQFVK
ncbi:unnamed protein product [Brachionus calyciflorus]|uniref:Reverse transcriptase domain-containing protein n=1 Tax=Brachionus calyciflorus TaxID=104777 RepID=A0A814M1M3_9BILA|nr:unnamed protein product [Brachionus calyciflorus]